MVPGFGRVYRGQRPHYEVWYGKVNIAPEKALWFRYTLQDGALREASTWAILFDEGDIHTGRKIWPLEALARGNLINKPRRGEVERFGGHPQVFRVGEAHLDTGNALGAADDISWDLRWRDRGRRFDLVPHIFYRLHIAKSGYLDSLFDLRISGTVTCGDKTLKVDEAPGMVGHIFGRSSGYDWAWVHCNQFDGGADVAFEGLSARVAVGGWPIGPLSGFVLFVGHRRYAFRTVRSIFSSDSAYGDGLWRFETRAGGARLTGEAHAPDAVALVEYTDTDGSKQWCYNSKLADLRLHLVDEQTGFDEEFRATGSSAFELVTRERPDREVDLR